MTDSTTLYCYAHPTRETSLRCKRCENPILPVLCCPHADGLHLQGLFARTHKKSFDTALWYDFLLGFVVAAILSDLASFLVTLIGGIGFFGWFMILLGSPTQGRSLPKVCELVTGKRRSRPLFLTVAAGVVLGALPILLLQLFSG
jgi:hypothetical protein